MKTIAHGILAQYSFLVGYFSMYKIKPEEVCNDSWNNCFTFVFNLPIGDVGALHYGNAIIRAC